MTTTKLQKYHAAPRMRMPRPSAVPEETLVADERLSQTPAQAVESKLLSRLQGASLPVSQMQLRGLVRGRRDG